MSVKIRHVHIGLAAVTYVCLASLFGSPSYVLAYGQSYYESYYESYYQSYYESYYQSSYQTTVTAQTLIDADLSVHGNISKGSGTFVIDHPLDPKNKLLFHSFVESPDVKNVYDGVVVLDKNGEAIVWLPTYFDALNTDVRYQLKPIGAPMPNLYVKGEERNNQFVIGGGVAGGKVSWQITGIRHDPYIMAHPIVPEVEKGPNQLVKKGEYLYPGVEKSIASGWLPSLIGFFSWLFGGR